MQTVDVRLLRPEEIEAVRSGIIDVYRVAFAGPPYDRTASDASGFGAIFNRHIQRPGFRLAIAQQCSSGQIVGFTYGYGSQPGQWWHDLVLGAMDPDLAAVWLSDCFEFAELAVAPAFQGCGFGGRLHDVLISGLYHRTAALSTITSPTPAYYLYRRRGWITLVDEMLFPGNLKPFRIMGLHLSKDGSYILDRN